jgi:electron transfer flavoprotein beta subunit
MSDPLRVIVCLKQVLDPEAPAASFTIDPQAKTISATGVPPVINPYDESALELALRFKEIHGAVKISALSFGKNLARPVLMKALAVGADELFLIESEIPNPEGRMTALVLAAAIRKIGADLILAGRQAADTNSGAVGPALAEILGWPVVCWVKKIELADRTLAVERVTPDGLEILQGPLPALVTVSHEAGELRMPKLIEIRNAKAKPISAFNLKTLELHDPPQTALNLLNLEKPARERQCRIIQSESEEEAGEILAQTVTREGIICGSSRFSMDPN